MVLLDMVRKPSTRGFHDAAQKLSIITGMGNNSKDGEAVIKVCWMLIGKRVLLGHESSLVFLSALNHGGGEGLLLVLLMGGYTARCCVAATLSLWCFVTVTTAITWRSYR